MPSIEEMRKTARRLIENETQWIHHKEFDPAYVLKLLDFVEAYDRWLVLFMLDGREDLEDAEVLGPAADAVDKARKALEKS